MVGGVGDELANSVLPSPLFPSSRKTIEVGSAADVMGRLQKRRHRPCPRNRSTQGREDFRSGIAKIPSTTVQSRFFFVQTE
jgi:hypothetical protein